MTQKSIHISGGIGEGFQKRDRGSWSEEGYQEELRMRRRIE